MRRCLEESGAELPESGRLVFVFTVSVGWVTAHLTGTTRPLFHGPAVRRWWHVELGDDAASWGMDVRVDEITGVRFARALPVQKLAAWRHWRALRRPRRVEDRSRRALGRRLTFVAWAELSPTRGTATGCRRLGISQAGVSNQEISGFAYQ